MNFRPSILIYGNPNDGFSFVGPFDTARQAEIYLEDGAQLDDTSPNIGWVAPLEAPLYRCDFGTAGIDYQCPRHLEKLFGGPDKPSTRIDDYVVVDPNEEPDARCHGCIWDEQETSNG